MTTHVNNHVVNRKRVIYSILFPSFFSDVHPWARRIPTRRYRVEVHRLWPRSATNNWSYWKGRYNQFTTTTYILWVGKKKKSFNFFLLLFCLVSIINFRIKAPVLEEFSSDWWAKCQIAMYSTIWEHAAEPTTAKY